MGFAMYAVLRRKSAYICLPIKYKLAMLPSLFQNHADFKPGLPGSMTWVWVLTAELEKLLKLRGAAWGNYVGNRFSVSILILSLRCSGLCEMESSAAQDVGWAVAAKATTSQRRMRWGRRRKPGERERERKRLPSWKSSRASACWKITVGRGQVFSCIPQPWQPQNSHDC